MRKEEEIRNKCKIAGQKIETLHACMHAKDTQTQGNLREDMKFYQGIWKALRWVFEEEKQLL